MAKLSTDEVRNIALGIVLQNPGGVRFGALVKKIVSDHPETPVNRIRRGVWDLATRFPDKVVKPSRSLFKPATAGDVVEPPPKAKTESLRTAGASMDDHRRPFQFSLRSLCILMTATSAALSFAMSLPRIAIFFLFVFLIATTATAFQLAGNWALSDRRHPIIRSVYFSLIGIILLRLTWEFLIYAWNPGRRDNTIAILILLGFCLFLAVVCFGAPIASLRKWFRGGPPTKQAPDSRQVPDSQDGDGDYNPWDIY